MTPLYVIRPQPGCEATVRAARDLGLDAHGYPLFAVRPLEWAPPPAKCFDALLIGSANALRHGGAALAGYRGMPAYAVGTSTAEAASAAGLVVMATGEDGLQPLLAQIAPQYRRLLRLAGRERIALDLPAGFEMTECEVYASEPTEPPQELIDRLHAGGVVMLHSAEAARHFAALCDTHAIPRTGLALAALGPRIAAAAGAGWAELASAPGAADQALLALADRMCQDLGRVHHTKNRP